MQKQDELGRNFTKAENIALMVIFGILLGTAMAYGF